MPLIKEERITEDTLLGIWEISESSRELESMIKLNSHESELLSTFHNETRRKHWLSYRILIRRLLGENDISVLYNDQGKPYMVNPPGYVSIAHSGCYSTVIYCKQKEVGIDIEHLQDRIEKVTHKYLSDKEFEHIDKEKHIQHLVTLWVAKEALYKLYGNNRIDFRENLFIEPFVPGQKGEFRGFICENEQKKEFLLHYFLIGDYVLAWVRK